MSSGDGFSFPVLTEKVPLGARGTVQNVTASGRTAPQPTKVSSTGSGTMEHRNKSSDPLLTRLVYGFMNWLSDVPLEKGYSQVDWIRQTKAAPIPKPRKDIPMQEVMKHKTKDDAWMVFKNRVYNITHYLRFHPGGADILLKAAGKDGTALFLKYHAWVNIDALLEKCLVGFLEEDDQGQQQQQAAAESEVSAQHAQVQLQRLGLGSGAPGAASAAGGMEEEEEVRVQESAGSASGPKLPSA